MSMTSRPYLCLHKLNPPTTVHSVFTHFAKVEARAQRCGVGGELESESIRFFQEMFLPFSMKPRTSQSKWLQYGAPVSKGCFSQFFGGIQANLRIILHETDFGDDRVVR